jgi:hypothetical protein
MTLIPDPYIGGITQVGRAGGWGMESKTVKVLFINSFPKCQNLLGWRSTSKKTIFYTQGGQ